MKSDSDRFRSVVQKKFTNNSFFFFLHLIFFYVDLLIFKKQGDGNYGQKIFYGLIYFLEGTFFFSIVVTNECSALPLFFQLKHKKKKKKKFVNTINILVPLTRSRAVLMSWSLFN